MALGVLDGVPAELEDLARARNAVRAAKLDLPILSSRVGAREGVARIEAIQDLIRAAVVVSTDTVLRRVAAELFYPHDGWERTYGARRLAACRLYGLETLSDWDRSIDDEPSPHARFLTEIARLVDSLSSVRPNGAVVDTEPAAAAAVAAPPARTRKVGALVATAAVALALTGALVAAQPSPTTPSAGVRITDPAVVSSEADAATGTTVDPATDTTIKQASLAPTPAPVVTDANGTSVALSDAAWRDYLALGLSASPTAMTTTGASTTIGLSDGGALVSASTSGPFFWIPSTGDAYRKWMDTGGAGGSLGLPTSNPFVVGAGVHEAWYRTGTYLEFQHGSLYASTTFADSSIEVVPATSPLGPLDGLGDVHDHILRQAGGQAWLVDENDVAHFVPDAATSTCLNGAKTTVPHDIPGYTIAAFVRGADATCVLVAD